MYIITCITHVSLHSCEWSLTAACIDPPQGDTLQGVAEELHCVLQSGYYSFVFRSTADSVSGTVELRYVPMASIYQNVGELTSDPGSASEQRLSDEQISDLVRKLGFLDGEGDVGYNINLFLHFNNVSAGVLAFLCWLYIYNIIYLCVFLMGTQKAVLTISHTFCVYKCIQVYITHCFASISSYMYYILLKHNIYATNH